MIAHGERYPGGALAATLRERFEEDRKREELAARATLARLQAPAPDSDSAATLALAAALQRARGPVCAEALLRLRQHCEVVRLPLVLPFQPRILERHSYPPDSSSLVAGAAPA